MSELLEPLATEAGQQEIARAIRDISSLENAVRAERAASQASVHAGQATQSALQASEAENKAKDWATKTDGYVEQETITIPPEQEGEEPTTETINLYSAKYYAAQAQDIFNNMSFDSVPTANSNNFLTSGTIYDALDGKADKSTTYTKTEVDTALSNVQSTLTFDNVPTANSDNPVKSSGIKTALDGKQDTLTFDSTPTANSTNPVTSGGIYTALQNVDIDVDTSITQNSTNPVTSAAIYAALQNVSPAITIDSSVTESSTNPVTSAGIYDAIENAVGAGSLASGVVEDALFESSTGVDSGTINLSGNISDYDLISIEIGNDLDAHNTNIFQSSFLLDRLGMTSNTHEGIVVIRYHESRVNLYVATDSSFSIDGAYTSKIYKITGIKFSKNLSEQMYSNVLYENSSGWSSGSITLSDDWNNYDFISVEVWDGDSRNGKNQSYYSKEFLESCYNNSKYIITVRYHGSQVYYKPTTNYKTFTIGGNGDGCKIYKIIGYKMAKGGYSGIVSDARMTVKSGTYTNTNGWINNNESGGQVTFDSPMPDTNYQVLISKNAEYGYTLGDFAVSSKTVNGFFISLWGRSDESTHQKIDWIAIRPNSYTREGMVEDVLFSNASGVNSGTINLSGNISDYDLIDIQIGKSGASFNSNIYTSSMLSNLIGNNVGIVIPRYHEDQMSIMITNDNTLSFGSVSTNVCLFKITGIKFGRYVSGVAVDTTVTRNSNAVVTSGAVYDALQNYTPSGGGSGGSITIDSVPTENSQNAVSSGGVYDALQTLDNKQVDVFKLSTHFIGGSIVADETYLRNTANQQIYSGQYGGRNHAVFKSNSIPCIFCLIKTYYGSYDMSYIVAISPQEEGLAIYKTVNESTSFSSDYAISVVSSGKVSNQNIEGGYEWYYKIYNVVIHPNSSGGLYYMNSSTTYNSNCGATPAQEFLLLANPTLSESSIKEELFYPTNYTITSGDTIIYNILKSLIFGYRPIQINGETYYFVKLDNDTYYYENPNNTITIDSSWVVTITAKSSGGSSITVDSTITQGGTNPVEGGAIYNALDTKADKSDTYTKQGTIQEIATRTVRDTTVTEDSSNLITSGAVFNAVEKAKDVLYLKNHSTNLTFGANCYISEIANDNIVRLRRRDSDPMAELGDVGGIWSAVKISEVPAASFLIGISKQYGNTYYNVAHLVLMSPVKEAVTVHKYRIDGTEQDLGLYYSCGSFYDSKRNILWHYSATDLNATIDSSYMPDIQMLKTRPVSYSCNSVEDAAVFVFENFIDITALGEMSITDKDKLNNETIVKEELFLPTSLNLSSGQTIPTVASDDSLTNGAKTRSLILYGRPIQINNQTYYYIKEENGTRYYANPNNTVTIDSSWQITITPVSSGGGGSSVTVDSTITQGGTNPVQGGAIYTALEDKADQSTTYTKTEVDTALASKGDVTTNTDQNITGTKTFVGSKKVGFKQSAANDKLGFTLYGNTGTERGYLEFNPTNTIDGVSGLMTLGNYATSANALTHVGFRRYSNISGANGAYNLLTPLIADAKTPFSLTTTYTNFYLPLGFTDGTTTVRTAKTGLVDLSPLLASLEARIAALEGN